MTQSIWEEFGAGSVDEIPENPFVVTKAEYPVNVSAEVKAFKEGGNQFFVIDYTIMEGAYKGMGGNRMFALKPQGPQDSKDWKANNLRTLSNLKRTLIELGLNAEQIAAFRLTPQFAQYLSGIKGVAEIGPDKKSQYNFVFGFKRNAQAVQAPNSNVGNAVPNIAAAQPIAPPANPQAGNGSDSGSVGSLDNLANLSNLFGGQG